MHMGHDNGHGDMDMGGQCNMNARTLRITLTDSWLTFSSSF